MADPIIATTAATLRTVAEWGLAFHGSSVEATRDELHAIASAVEKVKDGDDFCCPVCEEVDCDSSCPLAAVRAKLDDR